MRHLTLCAGLLAFAAPAAAQTSFTVLQSGNALDANSDATAICGVDAQGAWLCAGRFTIPVDLTQVPTPSGPTAVMSGESWDWQCWYRDNNPLATSNFTDGLEILFQ